jgi:hypothetical protein
MVSKRIGNSRSPELPEILERLQSNIFDSLYVGMPGKVVSYNDVTQTAKIKPLFKRAVIDEDGNEAQEEIPEIPNVPVIFPRGGGFFFSVPLAKNDNVLLLFMDKSIDGFMTSSGTVDLEQVDLREHNLSDAVAIPGFFPLKKAIKATLANDAVLGKENGTQLRATGDAVEITTKGAPAAIGGPVALANLCDLLWTTLDVVFRAWVPAPLDGGASLKAAYLAAFPIPPSSVASSNLKAD